MRLAIKTFLDSIRLFFLLVTPSTRSSLKRIANSEISELKKKNATYNRFRYAWTYRLIESIDNHRILFLFSFILLSALPTLWVNITPMEIVVPYLGAYQIPAFDFLIATDSADNGNNYHSIMATIQATVLALIIPITVALHEFVLKGKRLKEEMINFILKEARVRLITTSSLAFLIWVVSLELLKATFDSIVLSSLSNIVEAIWISINLLLIAYFMFTALNLINRSFFDTAIRRFIVNQIYPREMKGYLERNIFLNLSNKNEEGGNEES